jgi:orotate phosphoribosyltransferase
MTADEVIAAFREAGGLLEGHFVLSSGLHSPVFLQKMMVFQDPARTAPLCAALAARVKLAVGAVDVVVSPAVGGIIPGYETARALACRAVFVEREDGVFKLRRNFAIDPGERAIIVEDIVTTGVSARECHAALAALGVAPLCVAALIDRSGGRAALPAPLVALASLDIPAYAPDALPPELAAIPATKPGSRHLAGATKAG